MRIRGKRASQYSQLELSKMYYTGMDFYGNRLTPEQLKEIDKVYKIRKGENTSDPNVQRRV